MYEMLQFVCNGYYLHGPTAATITITTAFPALLIRTRKADVGNTIYHVVCPSKTKGKYVKKETLTLESCNSLSPSLFSF